MKKTIGKHKVSLSDMKVESFLEDGRKTFVSDLSIEIESDHPEIIANETHTFAGIEVTQGTDGSIDVTAEPSYSSVFSDIEGLTDFETADQVTALINERAEHHINSIDMNEEPELIIDIGEKSVEFYHNGGGMMVEGFRATEPEDRQQILDWVGEVYGEDSVDYSNTYDMLNSEESEHLFLGKEQTLYNGMSNLFQDQSFRDEAVEHFKHLEGSESEEYRQELFRDLVASKIDGAWDISKEEAEGYTESVANDFLSKIASGEQEDITPKDITRVSAAEAMIGKESVSEIIASVEQELAAENSVENSIETVEGDTFILSDNCPDKVIVQHLESGDYPMDEHGDIEAAIEAETSDILKDNKFELSYEEARSQVAGSISEYSKEEILESASREEAWPETLEYGSYLSTIEDELRERVEKQEADLMERDLMDGEQIEEEFFGESDQLERILVERDISSENVPMEELRDIQHDAANNVKEHFAGESESNTVSADDRQKSQYRELQRSMKTESSQVDSRKDLSEDKSQKQESDGVSQSM